MQPYQGNVCVTMKCIYWTGNLRKTSAHEQIELLSKRREMNLSVFDNEFLICALTLLPLQSGSPKRVPGMINSWKW